MQKIKRTLHVTIDTTFWLGGAAGFVQEARLRKDIFSCNRDRRQLPSLLTIPLLPSESPHVSFMGIVQLVAGLLIDKSGLDCTGNSLPNTMQESCDLLIHLEVS